MTWSSRPDPRRGFGKWVELHNPPSDYTVDRVTSLGNVRGSVVAAHSGDQGLLSSLLRPTDTYFDLRSTGILGTCRPFPEWFLPSLPATKEEVPALACVDNEADASAHVMADLYDNPLRRLSPQSSGTVRATVIDPLVAALLVTEALPGGRAPVWLHDLTPGGRDSALPARKFTRRKAGRIRGTTTVGRKLTVTTGRWRPEPATVRYRWFVGKKRLKKATRASLVLRPHMRGKRVRVKVTVVRDGYRDRTLTLRARGRVN